MRWALLLWLPFLLGVVGDVSRLRVAGENGTLHLRPSAFSTDSLTIRRAGVDSFAIGGDTVVLGGDTDAEMAHAGGNWDVGGSLAGGSIDVQSLLNVQGDTVVHGDLNVGELVTDNGANTVGAALSELREATALSNGAWVAAVDTLGARWNSFPGDRLPVAKINGFEFADMRPFVGNAQGFDVYYDRERYMYLMGGDVGNVVLVRHDTHEEMNRRHAYTALNLTLIIPGITGARTCLVEPRQFVVCAQGPVDPRIFHIDISSGFSSANLVSHNVSDIVPGFAAFNHFAVQAYHDEVFYVSTLEDNGFTPGFIFRGVMNGSYANFDESFDLSAIDPQLIAVVCSMITRGTSTYLFCHVPSISASHEMIVRLNITSRYNHLVEGALALKLTDAHPQFFGLFFANPTASFEQKYLFILSRRNGLNSRGWVIRFPVDDFSLDALEALNVELDVSSSLVWFERPFCHDNWVGSVTNAGFFFSFHSSEDGLHAEDVKYRDLNGMVQFGGGNNGVVLPGGYAYVVGDFYFGRIPVPV